MRIKLILQIINVTKKFGERTVLDAITYTFKPGFLYVLIGPSGCGKSTLLHIIGHVISPTSGSLLYNDVELDKNATTLILQHPHFYGDLSLYDNIGLVRLFNKTKRKSHIKELAKLFNIGQILKRRTNVCSGGEKARANIVRGIYENKSILLIDEPTAHLDYENSLITASLLCGFAKHKLMIVTTHEPEIFKSANCVKLYLKDGKLTGNA